MKTNMFVVPAFVLAVNSSAVLAQTAIPATAPRPAAAAAPVAPAETAATPAHAQAASVTPAVATVPAAPAAPVCEMHIWPAARVNAITQGAGSMFGLIGGLIDAAAHADQNKRDTAFIIGALDPAAQARALKEMDLPT